MKKEDFIEELETLILNNEDDFDRGKGKFILREFISSLKSSPQDKTPKVGKHKESGSLCPHCHSNIDDIDLTAGICYNCFKVIKA
jgi:hypothetical protein